MSKINRVNFRDIQALNGLRICGYGKRDDLLKIITSNRIDKMLKQGILESKSNIKGETVYTYTDKGKTFIKSLDGIKSSSFYSRQTASAEIEKMYSVPDIVYTTETGETVAIEVITENYTEQRIEMKETFCETVGVELRTVRV